MARLHAARRRAAASGIVLATAAYIGLAVASGLDRASESRPDLAGFVPDLMASRALQSEGRQALAANRLDFSLAIGEAAVRDAPLDPGSSALLGAARYARGDKGGAEQAFRFAARLGWRVPYTQRYMLGRALEAGDFRVAAMRLDALARQDPGVLGERRLFDPFERSAKGRTALVARMQTGPPWLRAYARSIDELPADRFAQRIGVLRVLGESGAKLGCSVVGASVSRLIAEGHGDEAGALWRLHCPGAAEALLYDGTFAVAALDQSDSEFAWTFIGHDDVSVVIEPGVRSGTKTLAVDSSAPEPRLVVRQLALLAPGSYRLSWSAQRSADGPNGKILAGISCALDLTPFVAPEADSGTGRDAVIFKVSGDCPAHWIGLAAGPMAQAARIGDVRLERLH